MWILPVEELHDKFIIEEFRAINTKPRDIKTIWKKGKKVLIPPTFLLNDTNKPFFFDKGEYLEHRYLKV